MIETILGVDPGVSGGFSIQHAKGIAVYPMGKTQGDTLELLRMFDAIAASGSKVAIIEEQRGFTKPGQEGMASKMFTFGEGYGFIQGALMMAGWRIELVHPRKWQTALSLGSAKSHATKSLWKGHLKAAAQRLYPGIRLTLQTCDAILLLEYYQRMNKNPVQSPLLV